MRPCRAWGPKREGETLARSAGKRPIECVDGVPFFVIWGDISPKDPAFADPTDRGGTPSVRSGPHRGGPQRSAAFATMRAVVLCRNSRAMSRAIEAQRKRNGRASGHKTPPPPSRAPSPNQPVARERARGEGPRPTGPAKTSKRARLVAYRGCKLAATPAAPLTLAAPPRLAVLWHTRPI